MATIGNYEIKKDGLIAEGGFARVYKARHVHLDELACIKQTLTDRKDDRELLRQEAQILWKLSEHHSIPHSKDFFELPDGSAAMAMSYIDGKSLDTLVTPGNRLHAEDACWITERLLDALHYCHYNGVVHSDIKPANVLVEGRKHDIKLIDFGLAVCNPDSRTKAAGYTEAYVAPEILLGKPPIPETDLYGAGLVMLHALGGNAVTKEFPDHVDPRIKKFCSGLLNYDPTQRPNWQNHNLLQEISDVRQEVFGRRHTGAYAATTKDATKDATKS